LYLACHVGVTGLAVEAELFEFAQLLLTGNEVLDGVDVELDRDRVLGYFSFSYSSLI